mmetsp:Transcript_16896/g.28151  ORF Transcript_16896/g.28151 Transcript_16896/m.28151 type:complete len:276 (-) Transcript_16896:156-983(-)
MACRRQLNHVHQLLHRTRWCTEQQQSVSQGLEERIVLGHVRQSIQRHISKLGPDAAITKEVVVVIVPPHQEETTLVTAIRLVVLLQRCRRVHLAPVRRYVEQYQHQECQTVQTRNKRRPNQGGIVLPGQNEQQTRRSTPIGHHIEQSTVRAALVELAGCQSIEQVPDEGGNVQPQGQEPPVGVEDHEEEADEGEDDPAVADEVRHVQEDVSCCRCHVLLWRREFHTTRAGFAWQAGYASKRKRKQQQQQQQRQSYYVVEPEPEPEPEQYLGLQYE